MGSRLAANQRHANGNTPTLQELEGIQMKMLKLTNLEGGNTYVLPAWIQFFRHPPHANLYAQGARTVLVLSGMEVAVKETPEDIAFQLSAI